jgi:hypothetical protein
MFAHDFPQTTTHPVAHHGAADATACYKSGTKGAGRFNRKRAKNEQRSALYPAIFFYSLERGRVRQATRFWKRKTCRWHLDFWRIKNLAENLRHGGRRLLVSWPPKRYRKIFPRKELSGENFMNAFSEPAEQAKKPPR